MAINPGPDETAGVPTGEHWRLGRRLAANALGVLGVAVVWIVALGVLAAAASMALSATGTGDFQWSGARMLLHHEDAYQVFLRGDHDRFVLAQFPNYLPLLLLLLTPFGAVGLGAAKVAWLVTNLVMAAVAFGLIAQATGLRGRRLVLCAGLFAASSPFGVALAVGQHVILVMFASVLALRWRSNLTAGSALAVAVTKFSFVPIVAGLVAQRRWRVLAVAVAVEVFGLVVFCAMTGSTLTRTLFAPLEAAAQSMASGSGNVVTIMDKLNPLDSRTPAYAAAIAAAFGLGWIARRRLLDGDWVDQLAVGSLISLVTLPHLLYDYTLLLPVAAAGLRLAGGRRVLVLAPIGSLWFAWLAGGLGVVAPYSLTGIVATAAICLLAFAGLTVEPRQQGQTRRSRQITPTVERWFRPTSPPLSRVEGDVPLSGGVSRHRAGQCVDHAGMSPGLATSSLVGMASSAIERSER